MTGWLIKTEGFKGHGFRDSRGQSQEPSEFLIQTPIESKQNNFLPPGGGGLRWGGMR